MYHSDVKGAGMYSKQLQECIKMCWNCRHMCQRTLFGCCVSGDIMQPLIEEKHLQPMIDCIQICQIEADFAARHSVFSAELSILCADICEACAKNCEAVGGDAMTMCAQICRSCAASCRHLSEAQRQAA